MKRLIILFSAIVLVFSVSCSDSEAPVSVRNVDIEMEKSTAQVSSYRFAALKGDVQALSTDPWTDVDVSSSFYAGSYEPGLWTFAVRGVDSQDNTVVSGQTVVYLSSGSEIEINISLYEVDAEGKSGNLSICFNPAPVEGTHTASVSISKINGDYQNCFVIQETEGVLSWNGSLECGSYTAETVFMVDGECYGYDVGIIRIQPETGASYIKDAEILPGYVLIDFADPRLDYNLENNTSSVCVGFKRTGTQDTALIDLSKQYLSPVGKFWSSCEDLGLEPVIKDSTEDLSSYATLALGSKVSTASTSGFMGQSEENPNTKLKTLVCYNSSLARKMFWWCTALEEVYVEDGVNSIGEGAFQNCSSLKKIFISSTVTNVGNRQFTGCTGETLKVYLGRTTPLPSGYTRTWYYGSQTENIIYGATRSQVFGNQ